MPTVSQPYGNRIPEGADRHTTSAQLNPSIPTWEGEDSRQGLGSELTPWALTEQLGEPRHRLWHWLYSEETWLPLAQADLIHHKRLRALARRLWPNRPPHWDPRQRAYVYSWREIEALCAAAIAEREAKLAQGRLHRWGVQ